VPRVKGQLPKAYLRIDPALAFTHPNPALFLKAMGFANMQPCRGRFKDWALVVSLFGAGDAEFLRDRNDLVQQENGVWYLDGWDIWQEGDLDVGERMHRYRNKKRAAAASPETASTEQPERNEDRNAGVTDTVTEHSETRSGPSEALGVRRTTETETNPPCPPADAGGPTAPVRYKPGDVLKDGREVVAVDELGRVVEVKRPPKPTAAAEQEPTEAEVRAAALRLAKYGREIGRGVSDRSELRRIRTLLRGGDTEAEIRARWDQDRREKARALSGLSPGDVQLAPATAAALAEEPENPETCPDCHRSVEACIAEPCAGGSAADAELAQALRLMKPAAVAS
jgi:hypothetical protein